MKVSLDETVFGWKCHWMNPFLDESVGWKCRGWNCLLFWMKWFWTKVFLDESVFGWKCFWMKVFLDEFFFAIWMKVYLTSPNNWSCEMRWRCVRSGSSKSSQLLAKGVVDGLPLWGGSQLAVDTPLTRDGVAQRGTATTNGKSLARARRRKELTYPELTGEHGRARLVVMGVEVGGRWSAETSVFLRCLAAAKARGSLPGSRAKCVPPGSAGGRGCSVVQLLGRSAVPSWMDQQPQELMERFHLWALCSVRHGTREWVFVFCDLTWLLTFRAEKKTDIVERYEAHLFEWGAGNGFANDEDVILQFCSLNDKISSSMMSAEDEIVLNVNDFRISIAGYALIISFCPWSVAPQRTIYEVPIDVWMCGTTLRTSWKLRSSEL